MDSESRVAGQVGGFDYVEIVTAGARREARLPMIVAMHGRGGRTERLATLFAALPVPARIIVPRGRPNGRGGFSWWEPRVPRTDPEVISAAVRPVEARMAAAITELCVRRPTLGKPAASGFSQGGMLAFSLAALDPDAISGAFPFGALLPVGFAGAGNGAPSTRPFVHAFHGARDNTVPIESTRWSIAELRRHGYRAELTEYPRLGHKLGAEQTKAALAEIAAFVSCLGEP